MSYGHGQYQYAAVPLPEQQHSYTGSTFTQKPDEHSSTLVAAQESASRKWVVRNTCLIATGILICLVGMMFAFLSFICVFHQCQVSKQFLVSTAPLGQVLTISQVTSHVTPLSVPIIMGLFSYLLSARWLTSSVDGGPNRPSPMQLGLLMSMCNGAGLSSLFSSVKYAVKRPENGQKVTQPPILRQSMVLLGSLLAVTYLTAAADSWLHASSTSIIIPSNVLYNSPTVPNFGREINATTCQVAAAKDDPFSTASCGILNNGTLGISGGIGEGLRAIHNASTVHQMVFTDDQTVIVVPLSTPPNITYSAKTLGVKSQCATITKECLQPTTLSDGTLDYGPDVKLDLDCTKAGIKYVNSTTEEALCALDNQGICAGYLNIPSNPFPTGEVATSRAYIDPDTQYSTFLNNTGWFFHGESGAWNVVFCNVTVLDVTYTYQSSRYIMQSASPKSLTDTRAIMSATLMTSGGTNAVSAAVEGSGINSNPTYEEAYSRELSRQMLGRAAHIYGSTNVLQIHTEVDVNGSKLQLIPLILFIGALVVFACQILYITLRIVIATWGAQYVELAALYLSNPVTTVQTLYGHPDPVLTWETDSDKKFGLETEQDRLRVGPVQLSNGSGQGSIFMVTKG